MEHLFPYPKMGHSWLEILHDQLTRKLLGFDAVHAEKTPFVQGASSRLSFILQDPTKHLAFLKIGYTALEAFLQANCTGPPLDFNPEDSVFPDVYRQEIPSLKKELLQGLTVDGNAAYALTPHVELFWLAKLIMSNSTLAEAGFNGRRARMRVNFWHQKLLNEKSDTLHSSLYSDADILEHQLASRLAFGGAAAEEHFVEFLMERAAIRIYYGDDEKAREDLAKASKTRHFQFAMTGALGKRTKFQVSDVSQLVVLAKSRDHEPEPYSSRKSSRAEGMESRKGSQTDSPPGSRNPSIPAAAHHSSAPHTSAQHTSTPHTWAHHTSAHQSPTLHTSAWGPLRPLTPTSPKPSEYEHHVSPLAAAPMKPENLPLNDDTLLEHIKFKTMPVYEPEMTTISDSSSLPQRLTDLDPANQPLLFPMDSIILLSTALSISNTSPVDGLTREETLPYATRVLDGGSSNWQVYTQALLVRSRIEGYRSRTAERGLLQLQALVDQVIAETQPSAPPTGVKGGEADGLTSAPTTFLPKPKASESASVAERLKYIYQLSPPLRWELEAELAARWTSMGGLKTALEIYERLQMNAEVALCMAATDREAEAVKLLKSLLFVADDSTGVKDGEKAMTDSQPTTISPKIPKLRSPPPTDSPRLLCILGDITATPSYYDLAWTVSSSRYARAQRSLGRRYVKQRDFPAAAQAYRLALGLARLDHATWFALGCVQLELEDWPGATETFTRCVQLEDNDAEAWSNLAVALLRLPPPKQATGREVEPEGGEDEEAIDPKTVDPYQHSREALRALRRAATLKRDNAKIWDNYLTVAASIPPSAGTPWAEIIQAMARVIELRGTKEGEGAIDLKILEVLVRYVTQTWTYPGSDESEQVELEDEDPDYDSVLVDEPEEEADEDEPTGPTDLPSIKDDTFSTDASNPSIPPARTMTKQLPHLPRSLLSLIDTQITPLATSSPPLYALLARVSLWRARPAESLAYTEKAWRAATSVPDAYEVQRAWDAVVLRTVELVDAYRTLGERERERTGGKVESGWKFKARNAVRSVLGRGRGNWEGTDGWLRLEAVRNELGDEK